MSRWLVTTSRSFLLVDGDTGVSSILHQGAGLYFGIAWDDSVFPGGQDGAFLHVAARRRMVSSPEPLAQERGCILLFDPALRHCGETAAPFPMRDMHQIMVRGDTLWATCSFDNMVAVRRGREWDAWYPLGEPEGEPRDINHFNTLGWFDGNVAIVAHNRNTPPSEILLFEWPSRALKERTALGVQAHDIWREDGAWASCSSGEGRIVSTAGRSIDTGGFPRGIGVSRDEICLGISELVERQARDLSAGRLRFYDLGWSPKRTLLLEGEGLVLDVKPAPDSWNPPLGAATRSFRFELPETE